MFPCSLESTAEEVDNPRCIYSHGKFLGVLSSNFANLWSMQRSPTRGKYGAISAF